MKIKCLAIDDEPLALEQITSYIKKTPFLEASCICKNAYDALDCLKKEPVQLLFIDIEMPDISGIDFVKSLLIKPQVIFTTAYSEYAMEGFKLDATDYLLKPFNYASFLKAVNKAKIWFEANTIVKPDNSSTANSDEIFVKSDYKMVRVFLNQIKFIESANEYIKIHLDNSEVITTFMRLKNIESLLPQESFLRIHKSFIIHLNKIQSIDRNRVFLDKKLYIPIGEQYKVVFNQFLEKHIY